eukprot:3039364-Prymnesium_polylepis.1
MERHDERIAARVLCHPIVEGVRADVVPRAREAVGEIKHDASELRPEEDCTAEAIVEPLDARLQFQDAHDLEQLHHPKDANQLEEADLGRIFTRCAVAGAAISGEGSHKVGGQRGNEIDQKPAMMMGHVAARQCFKERMGRARRGRGGLCARHVRGRRSKAGEVCRFREPALEILAGDGGRRVGQDQPLLLVGNVDGGEKVDEQVADEEKIDEGFPDPNRGWAHVINAEPD